MSTTATLSNVGSHALLDCLPPLAAGEEEAMPHVVAELARRYEVGEHGLVTKDSPDAGGINPEEFALCVRWIRARCDRLRTVARSGRTSYGYKHDVERDTGYYVTNGAFIAAAVYCGYAMERVAPNNPNAIFNVAAALRDLDALA